MFYVLHLTIWNLIRVSKNILQWSCFPTFKWERPMEKLKYNHLDGVFEMLLFYEIVVLFMREWILYYSFHDGGVSQHILLNLF